jgi:uncharacterized RDD family membrane protein YckC
MRYHVISIEKVPLSYQVAGLGSRFLAWLIDMAALVGLFYISIIITLPWEAAREGMGLGVALLMTFLVQWCYFLLFEWLWHGQTPGKRVVGIRVIDVQGAGISFGQSAVRNVLRVVDGLPMVIPDLVPVTYGLGFLVAACNDKQRRLGDLAADTLVVYVETRRSPLLVLQPEIEADASRMRTLQMRVEQLSRPQKETLLELCLRRDQLRVRERARLFAAVTDYFRKHLDLEPAEHQSPEKFILQLAAALQRNQGTEFRQLATLHQPSTTNR